MEDQHEGAGVCGDARPGHQRQQHRQRADIENQDAIDNLIGGFRDALLGIIGFRGGNANQLQAAEREHNDRHHHYQPAEAVRQEAALRPEVADAGLRAAGAAEQQPAAEQDHADHRDDFNDREPELHLAIDFYVGQVNGVDQHEEEGGGNPGGNIWPPELNVFADGGQLCHGHQHIKHPVVPARREAGKVAPVFVGEVAEAAGDRLLDHHLSQLTHN